MIAAVSPHLSATERREIAAAILKFSLSDQKMYSLEIARSLLVHVQAASMPRRIGPSAEAMKRF